MQQFAQGHPAAEPATEPGPPTAQPAVVEERGALCVDRFLAGSGTGEKGGKRSHQQHSGSVGVSFSSPCEAELIKRWLVHQRTGNVSRVSTGSGQVCFPQRGVAIVIPRGRRGTRSLRQLLQTPGCRADGVKLPPVGCSRPGGGGLHNHTGPNRIPFLFPCPLLLLLHPRIIKSSVKFGLWQVRGTRWHWLAHGPGWAHTFRS